ncbi:SUPPRESSOR OF GAMMA RESPONSE 1 [Eutrema salsugineum]|uniref:SUPPRESSOR OF GAMMA RESPONSE 1 n=1 Tax=Eutrema salsugineum TaxID=72664 RepID=UPI000CED7882|nr:SUPPRESSOR OF GAMMA RESPONSE 1 [Eutrema salsugineum]
MKTLHRAWIVDVPWIASNVKNASASSALQIEDCEAHINCPKCCYHIDNKNVLTPWPGLPKGVKFEPTDEEVIEHLEAKCGIDGLKPHVFIQDFICSSVNDINYTHPKNLPGVSKDGSSSFFFNKTEQAYPKGQRKRRRITPSGQKDETVRWRKTGKTKPVKLNGVQRGSKKFMVLYKSAKKGLKQEKYNWVMHQYHLGTEEEEIGEYVVSKIMYQKQTKFEKTTTSTPPKLPTISVSEDGIAYDDDTEMVLDALVQGLENIPEASFSSTSEERTQRVEAQLSFMEKKPNYWDFGIWSENNLVPDLEDADLGTLPDFLTFASEDSLLNWLD